MSNFENLKGAKWADIVQTLLVNNKDISEIETNGNSNRDDMPISVFYRQRGQRKEIPNVWPNNDKYKSEIKNLHDLFAYGEPESKFLDGGRLKLSDGNTARVHIVLPPAAETPQVTIAKKSQSLTTLDDLLASGTFDNKILAFLRAAIKSKFTIMVSGSTGAGKTKLLESLTKEFDPTERISVVEETPELYLDNPNTTYLHSTLWRPGMDVNDVATLEWCVQQVNEQRTDRIIIGETRGKEFADFITAANSGMEGSLTTIHANNPEMCLQKMSNFMISGLSQPLRSANQSIAQTIDFIIQVGNSEKYGHKITAIQAIARTLGHDESATIASAPIFKYREETNSWSFEHIFGDDIIAKFKSHGYDSMTFKRTVTAKSRPANGLGSLKL